MRDPDGWDSLYKQAQRALFLSTASLTQSITLTRGFPGVYCDSDTEVLKRRREESWRCSLDKMWYQAFFFLHNCSDVSDLTTPKFEMC